MSEEIQCLDNCQEQTLKATRTPTFLLYINVAWTFFNSFCIFAIVILYILLQWVVTDVQRDLYLSDKRGRIQYYDEILTGSGKLTFHLLLARLAACTNNTVYVTRYDNYDDQLYQAINDVLSTSPSFLRDEFNNYTFLALQQLIQLENISNTLVLHGKSDLAASLIYSTNYDSLKTQFEMGLTLLYNYIQQEANTNFVLSIVFTSLIVLFFIVFIPTSCIITTLSFIHFKRTIQSSVEDRYQKIIANIKIDKFKGFLITDLFSDREKFGRFVKRVGSIDNLHFSEIFSTEKIKNAFKEFCEKEWSFENLLIFDEILHFKELKDPGEQKERALDIYKEYISDSAPIQINISFETKKKMEERIKMLDFSFLDYNTFFNEVENDVKANLKDVMLRFQFSEDYNKVKEIKL